MRWNAYTPWPPGFFPVMNDDHAGSVSAGTVEASGPQVPRSMSAASAGSRPARAQGAKSRQQAPSSPITSTLLGIGGRGGLSVALPRRNRRAAPDALAQQSRARAQHRAARGPALPGDLGLEAGCRQRSLDGVPERTHHLAPAARHRRLMLPAGRLEHPGEASHRKRVAQAPRARPDGGEKRGLGLGALAGSEELRGAGEMRLVVGVRSDRARGVRAVRAREDAVEDAEAHRVDELHAAVALAAVHAILAQRSIHAR